MQFKQDMSMPGEDNDVTENFRLYENEESKLKKQEMERDQRDLVGKSLDTRSNARDGLSELSFQAGLFASKSSLSLKEVRFSKQEFSTGKPISDIKYHHSGSQNNKPFYSFND